MLLELRCRAGAEALVPAVVSAGSNFVHEQLVVMRHEELDGHHPDVIERCGDEASDLFGVRDQLLRDRCRNLSRVEDVIPVTVLRHRVEAQVAAGVAREDRRDLLLEGDEGLESTRRRLQRLSCSVQLRDRLDPRFPFSVVALGACLEHRRKSHSGRSCGDVGRAADWCVRRLGQAAGFQEAPLPKPVLNLPQNTGTGSDQRPGLQILQQSRWHVLAIDRDDIAAVGESAFRGQIVDLSRDVQVGDLRRGTTFGGIEYRDAIAHTAGFERDHSCQLPTADDPDRGARMDRPQSTSSRTEERCRSKKAWSRSCAAGSCKAMMAQDGSLIDILVDREARRVGG